MTEEISYVNIASYKFVDLDEEQLPCLKKELLEIGLSLELKGTILLGREGINLILAGERSAIDDFIRKLRSYSQFSDMQFKESFSDHQPFTKMLVRLKNEIVTLGVDGIDPQQESAPYLPPEQLETWYEQNKEMVVLDTRNDYEVDLGAFKDAIHLDIETFRAFPEQVKKLLEKIGDKTIVTYCTGGIRCEKAAPLMLKMGFKNVYQLEGGILNYFEKCGGNFYQGECFVFDKRVAVDPNLKETDTVICYSCGNPVTKDYQVESELCPHCNQNRNGKRFKSQIAK